VTYHIASIPIHGKANLALTCLHSKTANYVYTYQLGLKYLLKEIRSNCLVLSYWKRSAGKASAKEVYYHDFVW